MVHWEDTSQCPTVSHPSGECEGSNAVGDDTVDNVWSNREYRYLVIVYGKNDAEDNFTLSVTCQS